MVCGVKIEQIIRTQELHKELGIISAPEKIQWSRLILWPLPENGYRCFGVMLSQKTSKISTSRKNFVMNG